MTHVLFAGRNQSRPRFVGRFLFIHFFPRRARPSFRPPGRRWLAAGSATRVLRSRLPCRTSRPPTPPSWWPPPARWPRRARGILAADESTGTIGKRLGSIGVENTQANRQALRELLFTAPGFETRCSGVIMFEETLGQSCADGVSFVDLLTSRGIIPGIKVDKGVTVIPGLEARGETTTAGLDGLEMRCADFYEKGARFAKWRGVLTVGPEKDGPSRLCLSENASALARYAAVCQKTGLVPIVEPEILTDGDHDVEVSQKVTERVLQTVFAELHAHGVMMEGMILKPNMVTSGIGAKIKASSDVVAAKTVECLRRVVPPAVPGILFLSGGQTEVEATEHLNKMNVLSKNKTQTRGRSRFRTGARCRLRC